MRLLQRLGSWSIAVLTLAVFLTLGTLIVYWLWQFATPGTGS